MKGLFLAFSIIGLILLTTGCSYGGLDSASVIYSSEPPTNTENEPTPQPRETTGENASLSETSAASDTISIIPTGHPSNLGSVSFGASGMYNYYCFNGYIYQIVGDENDRILAYDKSDVSAEPIGSTYNPLYPDTTDTGAVYSVNSVSIQQSIAIEMGQPSSYCRADYFASDIVTYDGQAYQIAPISIYGILTADTESPYEVDSTIGKTTGGYDVYSYINPQIPGALAIDIPGMTCDLGGFKLYPMAVPAGPVRQSYSAMSFSDDNTGWLCETTLSPSYISGPFPLSAQLLKTTDGGKSWTTVWTAPADSIGITQLDFVNEQTGWAVEKKSNGYSLVKSIDGGRSWTQQLAGTDAISSIQFFDTNTGYIRQGDMLLKTSDGGDTWADITPPTNNSPYGEYAYGLGTPYFFFLNASEGWATGNLSGTAVVYYTADGGTNWTKLWSVTADQDDFISGGAIAINFYNESDGWLLLSSSDIVGGLLYHTTDGGKSFRMIDYGYLSNGRPATMKLYFTGPESGWVPTIQGAGGTVNGLMYTSDGGKTFSNIYINPDQYGECDCDDVEFTSSNVGYAFSGDHGCGCYVAGTTDGGHTWKLLR